MAVIPLGEAPNELSRYVDEVERNCVRVTITRHGQPAAVLLSAYDLTTIEETLEILSTSGAQDAIEEGHADAATGQFINNDDIKTRYGIT